MFSFPSWWFVFGNGNEIMIPIDSRAFFGLKAPVSKTVNALVIMHSKV